MVLVRGINFIFLSTCYSFIVNYEIDIFIFIITYDAFISVVRLLI